MSNFENRETVEQVVENRRSIQGRELSEQEVEVLHKLLDRPDFDEMSVAGRRAFYEFELRNPGSGDSTTTSPNTMLVCGWALLGVGALVTAISFALKTSVDSTTGGSMIGDTYIPSTTSSIINIGLLQNQMMVFQLGLALVIGGLLLIGAASVREAISGENA